jgi:glycosyltransferase involved in cell wall biosynthesis
VSEDRPLVTFALFAYNQEKYIREAVEGALAQTYSPLEIIISDDCSPDHTFAIIEKLTSAYEGPHKVILNRNSVNIGLGAHVAKIHAMACGEIIVHAAGDDISMSERVTRIIDGYLRAVPRPSLVETDAILIDEAGVSMSRYHVPRQTGTYRYENPWIKPTAGGGATYAVTRSLVESFQPMPVDFIAEDGLLGTRANLMNGVLYISEPLVKYRVTHTGLWNRMESKTLNSSQVLANEVRWSKHRIQVADQTMEDVQRLASTGGLSSSRRSALEGDLRKVTSELNAWLRLLNGGFFVSAAALGSATVSREHITMGRWIRIFAMRWAAPIVDKIRGRRRYG